MTEHRTLIETGWNFDNSYAKLPESFYSKLSPTPASSPELIILNERLAAELGLNPKALQSEEGIATLAGNYVPDHALPLAQAYAGHQFGHFTMLGDGRAVLLGEQITPDNDRFDIQFKGSGPTPYSRRGDGRAVLGPMLREYIVSEAMAALGIPTTLSLAVVATGEPVYRETEQSGAILTRVAASHIRVGTFQYAAGAGSVEDLRALADYTWERHFSATDVDGNRYLSLLQEVIKGQAELIAKWQLVGFIHGVMNTDNMALSGETIDYGPCAFLDAYDPATVFSSIDQQGRYAYQNQPPIAIWNLTRLAETLLPLLADDEDQQIQIAEDALADFKDLYQQHWLAGMKAKLGIHNAEAQDDQLFQALLHLMHKYNADYTNTFVALTFEETPNSDLFNSTEFQQWQTAWQARLGRQPQTKEASQQLMRDSNPAVIPRNHRVEEALKAAELEADYSVMERLLKVLAKPYAHDPDQEEYATLPKSTQPYRTYCGT